MDLPLEAVAVGTSDSQQEAGMQGSQRARAGTVRDMVLDILVRRPAGSQGLRKGYTPQA